MKNLIMRELYLARKTIRITLLVLLIFIIGSNLVLLSARVGNIAKYVPADELDEILPTLKSIFMYFVFMLGMDASGILNVVISDYASGWMKYINTTPVSALRLVAAKYISMGIITLCGVVVGTVNLIISGAISHIGVSGKDIAMIVVLCSIMSFFNIYLMPFALRFRGTEKAILGTLPIMLVLFIYFLFKSSILDGDIDMDTGFTRVMDMAVHNVWIFVTVIILGWIISFVVSYKVAKGYKVRG